MALRNLDLRTVATLTPKSDKLHHIRSEGGCGPFCGLAWSLTTIATGAVTGLASLFGVRLVLGMGEGATLPAATRAVSKWTPVVKRGTAIGATHAAGRLGAGTAAPIVALLITWFSWRFS